MPHAPTVAVVDAEAKVELPGAAEQRLELVLHPAEIDRSNYELFEKLAEQQSGPLGTRPWVVGLAATV